MPDRSDLIAEARRWIGRPYVPGGAQWCGVNCLGLFVAILRELGGYEALVTAAEPHVGFTRPTYSGSLVQELKRHLQHIPPSAALPGDLLVFRIEGEDQHLALLVEPGLIVHADAGARRVVDQGIPAGWRPRAAFRLPGLG